ncbi:MAG TPA: hypothetical protein VI636_06355 [Candidatus Angelobacter sp.]
MIRFSASLVLFALIAFRAAPAQDDTAARNESYKLCATAIQEAPQDAVAPCKAHVEKYPSGDLPQLRFVQRWLSAYEKLQPYIQYLQALAPQDQKASWFLYEPDLNVELPQTFDTLGPFKVEISRSFKGPAEEAMLKKAEAAYSSPKKMIEEVFQKLLFLAKDPPQEMAPIWGMRGNDNLQMANIVTARAVRYYYDLAQTAKQDPHLPTGFTAINIGLKYQAVIQFQEKYSHNQDTFTNVYVADLTLEWAFGCGGLCGVGFTRNKVVVLDGNGNILAMYLDSPVNSGSWVS